MSKIFLCQNLFILGKNFLCTKSKQFLLLLLFFFTKSKFACKHTPQNSPPATRMSGWFVASENSGRDAARCICSLLSSRPQTTFKRLRREARAALKTIPFIFCLNVFVKCHSGESVRGRSSRSSKCLTNSSQRGDGQRLENKARTSSFGESPGAARGTSLPCHGVGTLTPKQESDFQPRFLFSVFSSLSHVPSTLHFVLTEHILLNVN